jgi:prepilin-type N-terminal cleavage/methylation domain-containing protein
MKPASKDCSRRAMTLFEVLIALTIFSFAVIGCLVAYNSTLSAAREVRYDAEVRRILEDRVAELEGMELQEYEKEIDSGLPGLKIRESIRPEEIIDAERNVLSGFWKVEVTAQWERDGVPQEIQSSFLRYGGR